ncbi:MAG: diguanylate cyclase [Terracidiphilus sp.]
MRESAPTSHRCVSWLRKHRHAVRLASCFVSVGLADAVPPALSIANLIWIANAVLLAHLLLASQRRWPALIATGFAAQVAASAVVGVAWRISLLLSALHMTEVLIAAQLVRKGSTAPPRFADHSYFLRFGVFGVLAAPVAVGSIAGLLLSGWPRTAIGFSPIGGIAADGLGIAIATPVCVAMLRGEFSGARNHDRQLIYLLWLMIFAFIAISQTSVALLFFVYPLLVLVLLRAGMEWAAIATLFVAIVSGRLTVLGFGPFAQQPHLFSTIQPFALLQLFVGSGIFMLFTISAALEREREEVRQLEKIAAVHALVSENSRDAIILADLAGHRSYVSSAAENLGWKPEELLTQAAVEMIHSDDQQRALAVIQELNSGRESGMIECRVRKGNGEYIWVEASLRLVRNPETGNPSEVLNVVRDVSERKKAEQRLQEAYNAVEALAVTDPLTGLANRRRFDQYLAAEWRRSMRDRQPLSLIMLDVDKFKAYNDTYGHQRGDSCLKQIAEACMDVVSRPGDLVARFGGEEFVVILPNTENEGAMHVANDICEALRSRRLPHIGNALGIVTISAGCATLIPRFGKHAPDLIEMTDRALYRAKYNGRDQVCNGTLISESDELSDAALPETVTSKSA